MTLKRYVRRWSIFFLIIESVFKKDFEINKLMRHIYLKFIGPEVVSFGTTSSSGLKNTKSENLNARIINLRHINSIKYSETKI